MSHRRGAYKEVDLPRYPQGIIYRTTVHRYLRLTGDPSQELGKPLDGKLNFRMRTDSPREMRLLGSPRNFFPQSLVLRQKPAFLQRLTDTSPGKEGSVSSLAKGTCGSPITMTMMPKSMLRSLFPVPTHKLPSSQVPGHI